MDKKELFKHYEKLYFHEIEYRDKITTRLQLPLAIFISFLTLLGFMVQNINFACKTAYLNLFAIFFITSSILLLAGIYYFIEALYGHTYEFFPTANETEDYYNKLDTLYKEFKNGSELSNNYLEDYMYRYYRECSSTNAEVNDKRSKYLHKANSFIVFMIGPLLITFLIFQFGNVNKNMIEKIQIVEIKNPLNISLPKEPLRVEIINSAPQLTQSTTKSTRGGINIMSEKEEKKDPPPPPPPPPKRLIKEDVKIGIDKILNKKTKGE